MKNIKLRVLSMLLATIMVLAMMPFGVFAQDAQSENSGEPALPNAEVKNLGYVTVEKGDENSYKSFDGSYLVYGGLVGGSNQSGVTDPFDLQIAMEFIAKDTPEEAAANYYHDYTTDFFITIEGLTGESFVGDGCYLAGYYPSVDLWVKIPLDGFLVNDGTVYPVITGAGFNFSYEDICSSVQDFVCGIYMSETILEANPDLKVTLDLGLSENIDAALSGDYTKVDSYTYDVLDMTAVAEVDGEKYTDFNKAVENLGVESTLTLLRNVELTDTLTIPAGKTVTLDLNGRTLSQTKECTGSYSMIANNGTLTITGNGKISMNDTGANGGSAWGVYTIHNGGGNVIVENGTIENLCPNSTSNVNNAIFNYSGNTTINGGTISVPYSRTVRLWSGSVTINGGSFDGQVWVQPTKDCSLTIAGGSFQPATHGNDGSSVYITNGTYKVTLSVTGGTFNTKIGCVDAAALAGAITGGTFTETAKNNTEAVLLAEGYSFVKNEDGTYTVASSNAVVVPEDTTVDSIVDSIVGEGATEAEKESVKEVVETIVEELVTNEALGGDYAPTNVPEGAELVVKLADIVLDENKEAPTKLVFDVTPMNESGKVEPTEAITFRLPVPASVTEAYAKVYHEEEYMGIYEIKTANGAKYVEISSTDFSEFAVEMTDNAGYTLPNGVTVASFGDNTVTDGTNYYATLTAALAGVHGTDNAVLYCKPGADVGVMTHGHVCKTLTVYGNGAYISGGEQDFEIDQPTASGNSCTGLTGDMTLTVKDLKGAGAWSTRSSVYNVDLVFEGCDDMGKIFIAGTTGTLDITLTDCSFDGTKYYPDASDNCTVYSNSNGTITLTNVSFSAANKALNLNHKVAGTQTVILDSCTFTNCGKDVAQDQIPVRIVSSVEGGESVLTVKDCTFTGTPEGGADILLDYGVGTSSATISGTTATAVVETENNVGTTTNIASTDTVSVSNETITYVAQIGDTYYETLADAMAAATSGQTITLLTDIELSATVVIPAGKEITLDLNGKTITGTDNNTSGNFYLINNQKNATLIVKDSVGGGKITLTATTERNWSSSSVVIANNQGTLTIEGGTIEHLGGTSMAYGIDNLTNGTIGDAILTINGGTVDSTYFAVRQFANSNSKNNVLTINGGTVGYIWMQSPNNNVNTVETAVVGGEVSGVCITGVNADLDLTVNADALAEGGEIYGTMPNGTVLENVNGSYTLVALVATVTDSEGNVIGSYTNLAEAIAAATSGQTVTLLSDVVLDARIDIRTKLTFDLNGHTISGDFYDASGVIYVALAGDLTVTDSSEAKTGAITATQSCAIGNYGKLTVNGGTITGGTHETYGAMAAVYNFYYSSTMYGTATINGGTIDRVWNSGSLTVEGGDIAYADNSGALALNGGNVTELVVKDGSDAAGVTGKGSVAVNGGTISKITMVEGETIGTVTFDTKPADSLIPEGYMAVANGDGSYSIAVCRASVIDSEGNVIGSYATLADAIAAAQSGETVKLLADAMLDYVFVKKGVTLDLNGYKLTAEYVSSFGTVTDSSAMAGKLVVAKNCIHLNTDNAAMPIWDADGYRFAVMDMQGKRLDDGSDATTFAIEFRPTVGDKAVNKQYFADGMANNGLTLEIHLEWTEGDVAKDENIYIPESVLQSIYANDKMITYTVTGIAQTVANVKVSVVLISETGVQASQTVIPVQTTNS